MQAIVIRGPERVLTLEENPVMTEAWMPPAMIMRGMEAVTTSVIFQPAEKAIRYATANVTRFCTSNPTCARTPHRTAQDAQPLLKCFAVNPDNQAQE